MPVRGAQTDHRGDPVGCEGISVTNCARDEAPLRADAGTAALNSGGALLRRSRN